MLHWSITVSIDAHYNSVNKISFDTYVYTAVINDCRFNGDVVVRLVMLSYGVNLPCPITTSIQLSLKGFHCTVKLALTTLSSL